MKDVDNAGDYVLEEGPGGIWKLSVPSPSFCCDSITALQNKLFLKSVYENELYFYVPVETRILNSVILI